jgi:hypothetical protein
LGLIETKWESSKFELSKVEIWTFESWFFPAAFDALVKANLQDHG